MKINFLSLHNTENLIADVKMHKLTVNRDPRGLLIELLRKDWNDVYQIPDIQFGQSYFSVTNPGFARDENQWHVHPTKQTDRFIILSGSAVVGIYDWRKGSKTQGVLNLYLMGEKNDDDNQYLLLIPKNVLHGFSTVGDTPCHLISFPDHIYDPSEEGRIPFDQAGARFSDGTPFAWNIVREQFKS